MQIVKATNAKYATDDKQHIDCEITLEDDRVFPFTASKTDVEPHGVELFNILERSGLADYAYVPLPKE